MAFQVIENPGAARRAGNTSAGGILDSAASRRAREVIRGWPFYRATPLRSLRGLASRAGVQELWFKDESQRLPLRSFKMLGAAYALAVAVHGSGAALERAFGSSRPAAGCPDLRVVAATDGNHGRALAWAARLLGVPCSIYLPEAVSLGRERAIAGYGARTVRVPGSYDDAVRRAWDDARLNGWTILQDTALPGFEQHCRDIMHGYTLLIDEVCRELDGRPLTHVFVQAGVGGLAAAIASYLWHELGATRPLLVVVQSDHAPCVVQSLERGSPTSVPGPHDTVMGGIACGEMSEIAWETLRHTVDFAITIDDARAAEALLLCTRGVGADPAMQIGETGVAGLAALLAVAGDAAAARLLGLDRRSVVLCIGTEGITDPETYSACLARALAV